MFLLRPIFQKNQPRSEKPKSPPCRNGILPLPDAIFNRNRVTFLADIIDGASNTIIVAEARGHAVHWMQPDDVAEIAMVINLQAATHEHHASHLGGLHAFLADGSVRFISSRIDLKTLHGLVTLHGRETLGEF